MTHEEVDLHSETNSVHRRGGVVLRNSGPHSHTIHSLLRHLEQVGFDGCPRVVGSGFDVDGREMLTYIEGDFAHPGQRTVEALVALGQLLRQLHDATATYEPPATSIWRPWFVRNLGGPRRIIGHCDAAPWNVLLRDGVPVALIDWDLAGPIDPLVELAQASWLNAGLYSDDIAEQEGLPPLHERAALLRAIVDAYGLSRVQRSGFFDKIIEFAVHATAAAADE